MPLVCVVVERKFPDVALDDAARLTKCAELQRCCDERAACLDDQSLRPEQRLLKYTQLAEVSDTP